MNDPLQHTRQDQQGQGNGCDHGQEQQHDSQRGGTPIVNIHIAPSSSPVPSTSTPTSTIQSTSLTPSIQPPLDDARLVSRFTDSLVLHRDRNNSAPSTSSTTSTSRSDRPTSPDTTYSGSSAAEMNDLLGPLPADADQSMKTNTKPRPTILRGLTMPPRTPFNFSSPSPPSAGLSELMAGSPRLSGHDQSYFPTIPDPADPTGNLPTYSYHSDRSRHSRSASVFLHDELRRHSPRQELSPTLTSSDDAFNAPRAASDSGVLQLLSGRQNSSPKVRNSGTVLAPHGSFTSARSRSSTISSQASVASNKSPRSSISVPQDSLKSPPEMDPDKRQRLLKEAGNGDQLALYRLGFRPQSARERHSLGSIENVWGPSPPQSNINRFSSAASIASHTVPSQAPVVTSAIGHRPSDLFSDAAHLASRSQTRTNPG